MDVDNSFNKDSLLFEFRIYIDYYFECKRGHWSFRSLALSVCIFTYMVSLRINWIFLVWCDFVVTLIVNWNQLALKWDACTALPIIIPYWMKKTLSELLIRFYFMEMWFALNCLTFSEWINLPVVYLYVCSYVAFLVRLPTEGEFYDLLALLKHRPFFMNIFSKFFLLMIPFLFDWR